MKLNCRAVSSKELVWYLECFFENETKFFNLTRPIKEKGTWILTREGETCWGCTSWEWLKGEGRGSGVESGIHWEKSERVEIWRGLEGCWLRWALKEGMKKKEMARWRVCWRVSPPQWEPEPGQDHREGVKRNSGQRIGRRVASYFSPWGKLKMRSRSWRGDLRGGKSPTLRGLWPFAVPLCKMC